MEEKKLSFKTRLSYSFGDLACNILFAATANMASYFYTNIVGMSAAVVGTILLLSRMFDGFSDAIMGVIVDKIKIWKSKSLGAADDYSVWRCSGADVYGSGACKRDGTGYICIYYI